MTPEQIERREYSFCSVTYEGPLRWERFLVAATSARQAAEDARAYATERWGEPADVRVYPRNYVREARRLLAEGRYEGARPESEPEHDDGACARCGDTDGDVWVIIARPGYFCRHCHIQLTGRDPEDRPNP